MFGEGVPEQNYDSSSACRMGFMASSLTNSDEPRVIHDDGGESFVDQPIENHHGKAALTNGTKRSVT